MNHRVRANTQQEDGLALDGGTTVVRSLLCTAILMWGHSLNQKIGFSHQHKPGYNSFFLSDVSPMQRTKKWLCQSWCIWRFLQKKCFLRLTCAARTRWSCCVGPEGLVQGSVGAPIRGTQHVPCPRHQLWHPSQSPKCCGDLGNPSLSQLGALHSLWNTRLPVILGRILPADTHPYLNSPTGRRFASMCTTFSHTFRL